MRTAAAVVAIALLASGCGGGDGGSGISIDPSSLSFSAERGGSAPGAQEIEVTVTSHRAASLGAGWVGGVPSWLAVYDFTGDSSPYHLSLQVTDTSLAPGTYTATLRVDIADASENVIGYEDAAITYAVK